MSRVSIANRNMCTISRKNRLFSNINFCSKGEKEQEYCTKYHECGEHSAHVKCKSPKYANHIHNECQEPHFMSNIWFDCVNRMDEEERLFERQIFPINMRGAPVKLSVSLKFDHEGFRCGNELFKWDNETLEEIRV